jgi:hypothetical protein
VARWLNVEIPVVRHRRADLLGETAAGELVHIELQSTNHAQMALRMLEYATAIRRKFRRFPRQVVLYVGSEPLRMKGRLTGPGLKYRCRFADIRDLDAGPLLESASLEDNVIAVLARFGDELSSVRRILARIAESGAEERSAALSELMVLSGLRKLEPVIEREVERMPILDDIMDHAVLGRERKRGIEMGKQEILLEQIAQRFGPVPDWARQSVSQMSGAELQRLGLRVLSAINLEDLLS